jgi:hypothetical protein
MPTYTGNDGEAGDDQDQGQCATGSFHFSPELPVERLNETRPPGEEQGKPSGAAGRLDAGYPSPNPISLSFLLTPLT